jgi:uncharacterized protein (UPF0332 family)
VYNDLIAQARKLAKSSNGRPGQVDLRRAISSSYYACFHALAKSNADLLIGTNKDTKSAWIQTYRALEHGAAKTACIQTGNAGFSRDLIYFSSVFVDMQEERHRADYDPLVRFRRTEVILRIVGAEEAIAVFYAADILERRRFAAHVIFKRR